MAKQVVTWCDPCMGEDQQVPGDTILLTVGVGAKPMTLDLCPSHNDQLIKPLLTILDEYGDEVDLPKGATKSQQEKLLQMAQGGVRKGKPPVGPRSNQCLWCELSYSADGGGFGRHIKVVHGFTGFVEAFGGLCPVCGDGRYDLMLAHVKKAHADLEFTAVAQPFIWARDNGDPHGVYAATVAKVGSLDPEEAHSATRAAETKARSKSGT